MKKEDKEILDAAWENYPRNEYGDLREGFLLGAQWALKKQSKEDKLPDGFLPYQYQTHIYSGMYEVVDSEGGILKAWYNDIYNHFECEGYIVGYRPI